MKVACTIELPDFEKRVGRLMPDVHDCVQKNTVRALSIARQMAPKRTGDLRRGIIAPSWEEKSKKPNKVGREVVFDYRMNGTFVKMAKDGTRYYYPASQEFGFLKVSVKSGARERVPGVYFMKTSRDLVSEGFRKDMENVVRKAVEND